MAQIYGRGQKVNACSVEHSTFYYELDYYLLQVQKGCIKAPLHKFVNIICKYHNA